MWDVFLLFSIPVGGGIPAGVLLAKTKGISWIAMTVLYFASDVVFACIFEPTMKFIVVAGKRSPAFTRVVDAFKQSTQKTISKYGLSPSPFSLVMIAFGVDPITGRAATVAAGHGFLSGWTLAIIGDMFFFLVLMSSTLWLNNILGDGTWTAIIVMVGMMVLPGLIRRVRDRWH